MGHGLDSEALSRYRESMGNLFPDSDDYPDHHPLAGGVPTGEALVTVGAIGLTAMTLCPAHHPREHSEIGHTEYAMPLPTITMTASGVSSPTPNPAAWGGNTVEVSANVAIQARHSRRQPAPMMAGMYLAAVPFVEPTPIDWLPRDQT